ncbi:MAG: AtpZ/AtpI family protein [Clostridia bacterium]|nr:AtpZ/AtpI family protein [Clostridia bacterium]
MKNSYRKFISPLYVINMVFQSIISLISPIAVMFLIAYLITKYTEAGGWIYVVFIMLGVFSGFYSMIVFIIRSSRALEAIERQNKRKEEDINKNGIK